MVKRKKLNLKVVFDTNVIYTGSASDLFRNEIAVLINDHKTLSDIEIEWYMPETVIKERIFQMNKKGNELLPSILKLEKLLGHNLNITKEIIESRVNETISKQLSLFEINTIKVDTSKVDWDLIINNSLERIPPFEDNEKEKGFRDSLILESLKQIIATSPVTKTVCRIVFITNDIALNKAANLIDKLPNNINIFSSVEELISLINILDSEITEDRIAKIILDADKLFFEPDDKSTFFYAQNLKKQISETFSNELSSKENGADSRENGTWYISKPGFEKKSKQLVTWKTNVSIDFVTYRTIPSNLLRNSDETDSFSRINYGSSIPKTFQQGIGYYKRDLGATKEKINDGKTKFEITWSVTLTTDNKIKNPKIDNIKFLETIFT